MSTTPMPNYWAQEVTEQSRANTEAQVRMKELMQQHIFENQQQQQRLNWSKNNMTAYESANLAQQESDRQAARQTAYDKLKADGYLQKIDPATHTDIDNNTPTPPQQQSPAQKVVAPAAPFDFATAGQVQPTPPIGEANPATGNGSPGMAASPASLLLGQPNGSLTPTGASASQGQTGALGQSSLGVTSPSQTAAGQTGKDSGPAPAPQGMAGGAGAPFVPDHQDSQGMYRWTTPDERAATTARAARQQAIEDANNDQAIKQQRLQTFLARPENKDISDFSRRGLEAEVAFGKPLPEETATQMESELMGKATKALDAGDMAKYQSYKDLLGAHLTHGQNSPQAKMASRPDGSVYAVTPGVVMGPQDKILGEASSEKEPTPGLAVGPDSVAYAVRPGTTVKPGSQTLSGVNTMNTPTSQMRSRGEMSDTLLSMAPTIKTQIDQLTSKIGPGVGRWNDYMVGKLGKDDPEFANLQQHLHLYASGVAVAHFGMRGSDKYRDALDKYYSATQSPDDLKARIDGTDDFLEGYAKKSGDVSHLLGGPIQPKTQTTTTPPPPPTPLPFGHGSKMDPPTAKKFLDASGGDKDKARTAAKSFGWQF